jgi:acyl-CoA synthetase (AMP-forming)/AMP-acid ligase II
MLGAVAAPPTSPPAPAPALRTVGFARALAGHGDRVAVLAGETVLTYADLASRVEGVAGQLGPGRRLVLVAGADALEPLVAYLAGLAAGHPVLLAPGDDPARVDALVEAYDPDVVVRPAGGSGPWRVEHRREGSAHDLHPDLALLLTTSGSTGSPKLVRLSHRNLDANARAIADYLGIGPDDRAATTLPMHYCYGLSVINSHLAVGAALVLTDLSVVDACFWQLVRDTGVTSLAGVPYTFDLLDRVGFADMHLPHLRRVTQAGGRLAPDRVRRFAELGRARGFDLVVMYGATEATARMAYLPPDLAAARPEAVGVPVPGGSFRLDPVDGAAPGVGELVYSGPNVMLGYAESPRDLRLGATLDELRTGDLARQSDDGLYEVVGRRNRLAKVYGVRVDLQHLEVVLARHGLSAACAAAEELVIVAVEAAPATADHLQRLAARACGLPVRALRVVVVPALPRLANGKPDLQAVRTLGPQDMGTEDEGPGASPRDVLALFAEVLDRPDARDEDTFVGLGGDSLSYVELSLRLEDTLGHLPDRWHLLPIATLAASAARPAALPAGRRARGEPGLVRRAAAGLVPSRWPSLDGSVALRAAAIVLVVGSHANVFALEGGAHLLLAVVGYNLARFHVTSTPRRDRQRALLRSTARLALPSLAWIVLWFWLSDDYHVSNLLFLTSLVGPDRLSPPWEYWFLEAVVQVMLVLVAVLGVPAVDRLERRWPFGFAVGLLGLGLLPRTGLVDLGPGPDAIQSAPAVLWLVALGWATAKASTVPQRVAVTAAAALAVPGFFGDPRREAVVLAGLTLLLWVPSVRLPRPLRAAAGLLAANSLYVYLTHWQVFPHLQDETPRLALAASLVMGIAYGRLVMGVTSRVQAGLTARRRPAQGASATPTPLVDAAGPRTGGRGAARPRADALAG